MNLYFCVNRTGGYSLSAYQREYTVFHIKDTFGAQDYSSSPTCINQSMNRTQQLKPQHFSFMIRYTNQDYFAQFQIKVLPTFLLKKRVLPTFLLKKRYCQHFKKLQHEGTAFSFHNYPICKQPRNSISKIKMSSSSISGQRLSTKTNLYKFTVANPWCNKIKST